MKALFAVLAIVGAVLSHAGWTAPASVTLVRVPGNGIQPEATVDSRGVLHLLYFSGQAAAGNLFYVRSNDYGTTFSSPVRVNSQEESAIATGTIRGGQLAVGRDGRVHVAWNGSDGAKPRGLVNPANGESSAPLLYARSTLDGKAFEPQRNLTHRSYGLDGGGSIAADAGGRVWAAWHALAEGGPTGEDHRLVWIARSDDDGATFAEEQPAWREPTGACGCCGLRLFAGPLNSVYLLYRSATAVTHRDIYLLQSTDQGRSFAGSKVHPWEIGACPMSSMSIAASASRLLGAWETAGQVYFGVVDPHRAMVASPVAAPGAGGTRKHPRLAAGVNGDVLFAWTDGTGWARGGAVAWQLFDATDRATGVKGRAAGVPVWSFATPIARPDGGFVLLY